MLEDEEELIKKVAAQEQITNKETKDLNYKVLSKRLTTIQEQKAPLEDKLREFIDYVFDEQEKYKVEKGITTDNDKKQTGGVTEASPDELITAYASKNGIDPRDLMAELENMEEGERQVMMTEIMSSSRNTPPTEEAQPQGGQISPEQIIMAFAEQQGVDPQEVIANLESLSPEEQQQVFQEMAAAVSGTQGQPQGETSPEQIIMAFAEQQGVDPQEVIANLESLSPEEQQQVFQEMAASVSEGGQQAPQEGAPVPEMQGGGIVYAQAGLKMEDWETKYLNKWQNEPITPEGVRYSFEEKEYQPARFSYLHDKEFTPENLHQGLIDLRGEQLINERPQSTNYILKTEATRRELGAMAKADPAIKKELEKNGVVFVEDENFGMVAKKGVTSDSYTKEQKTKIAAAKKEFYQNNTEDVTFPALALGLNDKEEYYRGHATKTVDFENQEDLDKYLKTKNWKQLSNGVYETDKAGLYFKPTVKKGPPAPNNSQLPIKPLQRDEDGFLMLPPQLPGRENLPPNLLMPTLRQTRAFQADPLAISPNSTIRETARSVRSQQQMLEQMDPSLAAGNVANLTAEEANANANAIEKANLANQADRRQVDTLNEDRQKTALDTNLNLQANYEQLGQTALQNFYDENRNFITKRNNDNIENWNVTNKINAYNAANPNYKMTSSGAIVQVGRPFFWADSGEPLDDNTELFEDAEGIYAQKNGKKVRVNKNENKPGLVPSLSTSPINAKKGGKISFKDYLKKSK